MIRKLLFGVAAASFALAASNLRAASTADIVFLVDESGSMAGEHAWLASMVTALDTQLASKNVTANQYALVGFGAANSSSHPGGFYQVPHAHNVGGGLWGTAAQLSAATSGLVVSGGFEDGWAAISYALDTYTFRSGAAVNFILVTDEDRDATPDAPYNALTKAGTINSMTSRNILLNAVVDANLRSTTGSTALGHDSDGNAYVADGSGGYTVASAGNKTGYGTTISDYYDVALATGGATWDLNQLRAGGLTAQSFTAAFVDIKVEEIIIQTPDGGSAGLLLGMGVLGLAALRRRFVG